MTEGKPSRLIISFAVPMLIGNIFQQLYSMVDSIVLGRFVSKDALASVGATSAVLFLMISVIIGFTVGVSIVTAQYSGAKDTAGLRSTFATGVFISLAAAILLGAGGCAAARPVLRLLNTPGEIIDDAVTYLIFNFATCIAPITYNMSANFLRSLGDSRTPLYALVISSLLNIALDLLFVLAFDMGVAGVAIATAISQGVSTVYSVLRLRMIFPDVLPRRGQWRPSGQILKRVVGYGVPMSVQNAFTSFGMMSVQRVINGFGTDVVAGYSAASKVDQLALHTLNTIGSALSTYAGQNFGAKSFSRIKSGTRSGLLISSCVSLALSAVIFIGGRGIVRLFLDSSETAAIDVAVNYLRTVSLFYILCGAMYVYTNVLRGVGRVVVPTLGSFLELGVKIAGAFVLSVSFGYTGIWYAWPAAWLLVDILLASFYRFGKWSKALDIKAEQPPANQQ